MTTKRRYRLDNGTAAVLCVALVALSVVYASSEGEERSELLALVGGLGAFVASLVRPLLASHGDS